MSQTTIFVYPTEEDKRRDEFLALFAQSANWDLQKTSTYFNESNPKSNIFIKGIDSNRAPEIIDEFYKLGVAASIFMLEPPYQKKFFDIRDGKKIQWNWFSAIFGSLWYLVKGMGLKFFILLFSSWIIGKALSIIDPNLASLAAWASQVVYCGLFGTYDYYLAKAKNEKLWLLFPSYKWSKPLFFLFVLTVIVFFGMGIHDASVGLPKFKALFDKNSKASISQFESKHWALNKIPPNWQVITNFPKINFLKTQVKISRPIAGGRVNLSQNLSTGSDLFAIIKDSALISAVPEAKDSEIGLVTVSTQAIHLRDKNAGLRSKEISDLLRYKTNYPFYLKWLMKKFVSEPHVNLDYIIFANREWLHIQTVQEMHLGENFGVKFYYNTYSTLLNNRLITVVSQAFENTKATVDVEVRGLLESFIEK